MKEDLRGLVMRADVFGMLRAIEVGPATFCVTAGLTIARDKPMSIRTGLIQLISLRTQKSDDRRQMTGPGGAQALLISEV